MNFVGANSYMFRKMHDTHHQFVNIHGVDVTLETHGLFRFTPDETWKPIHRIQHLYIPILYSLVIVHWVFIKDFKWFFGEKHIGNHKNIKHPFKEYLILFFGKIVHLGLHFFLPLWILNINSYWIVSGYLLALIIPGFILALIFQVGHIYDGTHYPIPDKLGNIENNYAIHILETTADFSRNNKFVTWLTGGLNNHAIHHIFPGICHIHYPALTNILIETAKDFDLIYKEHNSVFEALKKHFSMLHKLSSPKTKVLRYSPH